MHRCFPGCFLCMLMSSDTVFRSQPVTSVSTNVLLLLKVTIPPGGGDLHTGNFLASSVLSRLLKLGNERCYLNTNYSYQML